MRITAVAAGVATTAAFIAGAIVSPALQHLVSDAHAQTAAPAALTAAMIDLAALKHGDLPTTPNAEMNNRLLVATANATIALQSGNVKKHMHPMTDEIQYII